MYFTVGLHHKQSTLKAMPAKQRQMLHGEWIDTVVGEVTATPISSMGSKREKTPAVWLA
jgi:hypothetical protein